MDPLYAVRQGILKQIQESCKDIVAQCQAFDALAAMMGAFTPPITPMSFISATADDPTTTPPTTASANDFPGAYSPYNQMDVFNALTNLATIRAVVTPMMLQELAKWNAT